MVNMTKPSDKEIESLLWVDKYKPTSINKIIGQQGEKSCAKKLHYWLNNWHKFHGPNAENAKGRFNRDDGLNFKAALLSGPPGIGKTTTAELTCQESGFSFLEMNASDTRSKKLLDVVLGESSSNTSIESFMKPKTTKVTIENEKHCIIMDEVDGMAGNEDRGGIQELISVIKESKVPIICICNDRNHPKIRSLSNHCFDLRFSRPRVEQIRGALLTICFKENIKIAQDVLDQIIVGANHDIRQCLYNLSVWSANRKTLSSDKTKIDIEKAVKDVKMNPFEAARHVFLEEAGKNKITDKMELFFCDYSFIPLLVHENYLSVTPNGCKKNSIQHLQKLSESIDSICEGDRISRLIRTTQSWSLLPTQSIFSCVVPGMTLSGSMGFPAFSSWFGKYSKQGRIDRILQELQKHMRLKISANKYGVGMEYLSVLKDVLSKPLLKKGSDGVNDTIDMMNEYYLTREDFDTIFEIGTWPGQPDLLSKLDSKVKAAFTRAYNKESHKNPFVAVDFKKIKSKQAADTEEGLEEETVEVESENDEDNIDNDVMIKKGTKASKPSKATATKTTAAKTTAAKTTAAKTTATKAAKEPTKTTTSTKRAAPATTAKGTPTKKKRT